MQLPLAQLETHLRAGLRPLYTVSGDEILLVQEACDAVRAAARAAGHTERQVLTLQGARADWSHVLAAGAEQSLFAQRQVVELRLPSGKPGKDGEAALVQLAQAAAANPDTLTLVVLPRLDRATQAKAWVSALSQHGVWLNVAGVERSALPGWIAHRLSLQGQRVADGTEGQHSLQTFAERVEGNLLAAHQEVLKLGLLYPAGVLSAAQIDAAVGRVARYDVFELSAAVLGGQLARAQRMIEGLRAEGEAEVLVHYTLAEDIRALLRAKNALASGKPMPLVLREQRVWGAREKLFERVLPRLSAADLAQLLHAAHRVDGVVKGLKAPEWPADPWLALSRLAWLLGRRCAGARAA